jgi:hypothetical protein
MVAPVDVDVNVTVCPVNGSGGEYVNEATGAADAGAAATPTATKADNKALTSPRWRR